MTEKRPGGFITLCILSWIYIGFKIIGQINALFSGRMTDDQIRDYKIELLKSQTEETLEIMGGMIDELVRILEVTRDNMYFIAWADLLFAITGGVAVYLMFQGRKIGFHLYIIYSLLALAVQTYFFSGFTVGLIGIVFTAVISIIFILIYRTYLKLMR